MKKSLFFGGALALAVLCGCRSVVHVNGKSCRMLYDSEIQELQAIAIATLKHNLDKKNVITPDEYQLALKNEPTRQIFYAADLTGRAEFLWDFPIRKTTVVIQGEFLNPKRRLVFVSVDPKQPSVIDTTHQLPSSAQIFQQ